MQKPDFDLSGQVAHRHRRQPRHRPRPTPGTAERLDDPAFLSSVLERIPVGRVGTTADVVAAVIFLASRPSGLITGAVLPVDGGWTAQ
jgi:NAD(P)-dependent dehydrogenase (short-subunit alcohol dehydrogenase family)